MRNPRHPPADPERLSSLRVAAAALLGLGGTLVIAALMFDFGDAGAALNGGVFGALLALLALGVLRRPFGSGPLTFLTGLIGLWLVVAPFVLDYFRYLIPTALTLWAGLLTLLLSAFIYGEANRMLQPLGATD